MEKYTIRINGVEYEVEVEKRKEVPDVEESLSINREIISTRGKKDRKEGSQLQNGSRVTAGTAGKVWKVIASEGATIKKGESIVVLEAMKMEIPVVAPCDGKVGRLLVSEGDSVDMGQEIAVVA